jgi:hypothetical protein
MTAGLSSEKAGIDAMPLLLMLNVAFATSPGFFSSVCAKQEAKDKKRIIEINILIISVYVFDFSKKI